MGDESRIYPLCFAEFYAAFGGAYDDAWNEYMIYGGLPQVVRFPVERQKAEYFKSIFTNVYVKDVVERNNIQNLYELNLGGYSCLFHRSLHQSNENIQNV